MPRTPDEYPGQRVEDSLLMLSGSTEVVSVGEIRFVSGSGFHFMENDGIKTLSSSIGLTEAQHEALFTLTHEIVTASFDSLTYSSNNLTNYTTWIDSNMLQKIQETRVTYNGNNQPTLIVSVQYNVLGAVKNVVSESFSYSSNRISSITRV